jgi:hypothetical protein
MASAISPFHLLLFDVLCFLFFIFYFLQLGFHLPDVIRYPLLYD